MLNIRRVGKTIVMVKILVHLNDLLFYLLQSYKTFSPFTIKKSITSKNLQKSQAITTNNHSLFKVARLSDKQPLFVYIFESFLKNKPLIVL